MTNPLPTEQQIAEIAKGLSKAQRDFIVSHDPNSLPEGFELNHLCKLGLAWRLSSYIHFMSGEVMPSRNALRLRGLAVRAHLTAMGEKAC